MNVSCHTDRSLGGPLRERIAAYRYQVFVRTLGWDLPCRAGREQDEFDTADALHVVASDEGRVLGYARLLPTTAPYLLATHFSPLLNGLPVPADPRTWEISRYAAIDLRDPRPGLRSDVGRAVLRQAIRIAQSHGADRFVCCTAVAIERVALRWGLRMRRLGVPMRAGAELVVAAQIDFDSRTLAALSPPALPGRSPAVPGSFPNCRPAVRFPSREAVFTH